MYWIITFFITWLLLFTLVGWNNIVRFFPIGLFSTFTQVSTDYIATSLEIYSLHNQVVHFWGSSLFLSFGLAFAAGIIIARFFPSGRLRRLLFLSFLILLALLVHLFFINMGYISFTNFNIFGLVYLETIEILAISGFYLCFFYPEKSNELIKFK